MQEMTPLELAFDDMQKQIVFDAKHRSSYLDLVKARRASGLEMLAVAAMLPFVAEHRRGAMSLNWGNGTIVADGKTLTGCEALVWCEDNMWSCPTQAQEQRHAN